MWLCVIGRYFAQFGKVVDVLIPKKRNQWAKKFCFVRIVDERAAQRAVRGCAMSSGFVMISTSYMSLLVNGKSFSVKVIKAGKEGFLLNPVQIVNGAPHFSDEESFPCWNRRWCLSSPVIQQVQTG